VTRIVAGSAGGRRLTVPSGRATRPTAERTREGLFSTVESMRGPLTGAAFLDLYAGSGAVGLEAASRGALRVVLVDNAAPALRALRSNVDALGLGGVEVRNESVERLITGEADLAYDVVFLDPPYTVPVDGVLDQLDTGGWLASDAVVVVERATRSDPPRWPAGIVADRSRRYGDTTLWYGRRP
jgi:16S rRNA (guanine966-N2)-methyltransferase